MDDIRIDVSKIPFDVGAGPRGPRPRTSEYFLTMSTNVRFDAPPSEIQSYADRLVDGITAVFGSNESIKQFVRFPPTRDGVIGRWEPEFIDSAKVTAHAEVGLNARHGRRLHAHVLFKVVHRCRTRLDLAELKRLVNVSLDKIGFPWPVRYLHCRVINNAAADYMLKHNYP
ncbi:MAG: hypothetical protein WDA37_06865 [Dysgonamonadaceae bacterium]|jgi:hypothetical protein